ncbi:hypothetical protein D3C79_1037850 [compost metagenome]
MSVEGGVVECVDQFRQSIQELLDVLQQLHRRNAWRLHAEQHPGLPVNLPQGAEHRIAELQLHPQALVERCLADMREQTPRGFVGHFLGGCRTEQQ